MDSKIKEFYKNKTIFITGGSGFVGKVIIEKLLRSTEVKHIYILIRPKRGVDIQSRIAAFAKDFLFSQLLKKDANFLNKVSAISGDCKLPDLGLRESDRKLLLDEVQVVVHSAATVDFMAPLSDALSINTLATRLMIELAKQMPRLEAFVHVSSAYSSCPIEDIKESFYPELLTCTSDKALALKELLDDELINSMTPALLGKFPNTYTYTKALAEQIIQRESGNLPICIFRPGMILPIYKEPTEGWINNLYGPISILLGCAYGILRVMIVRKDCRSNIVPADYCGNLVLASAWHAAVEATQRKAKSITELPAPEPPIYNFAPTVKNALTWNNFADLLTERREKYAFKNSMWLPFLFTTSSFWLYELLIIFYHHIPGFFIDMALRLKGQKPQMKKMYAKIHNNIRKLAAFSLTNWTFEMHNSTRLLQCMSPQDQEMFEFDMDRINWDDYFDIALGGARTFLANDPLTEESLTKARKKNTRFFIANFILHFIAVCVPVAVIWYLKNALINT